MKRVMVVGTSCAGKTTLARGIAQVIEAPHVELDALHWGPAWAERPRDEFRLDVERRVQAESWVVDGNYHAVRDLVVARATDAVWLNYSFGLVFRRAVARTWRRVRTGEELFGGNRETFALGFLRHDSIPWWVVRTHRRRSREYRQFFDTGPGARLRLVELTNQDEADRFLQELRAAARSNNVGNPS